MKLGRRYRAFQSRCGARQYPRIPKVARRLSSDYYSRLGSDLC